MLPAFLFYTFIFYYYRITGTRMFITLPANTEHNRKQKTSFIKLVNDSQLSMKYLKQESTSSYSWPSVLYYPTPRVQKSDHKNTQLYSAALHMKEITIPSNDRKKEDGDCRSALMSSFNIHQYVKRLKRNKGEYPLFHL